MSPGIQNRLFDSLAIQWYVTDFTLYSNLHKCEPTKHSERRSGYIFGPLLTIPILAGGDYQLFLSWARESRMAQRVEDVFERAERWPMVFLVGLSLSPRFIPTRAKEWVEDVVDHPLLLLGSTLSPLDFICQETNQSSLNVTCCPWTREMQAPHTYKLRLRIVG